MAPKWGSWKTRLLGVRCLLDATAWGEQRGTGAKRDGARTKIDSDQLPTRPTRSGAMAGDTGQLVTVPRSVPRSGVPRSGHYVAISVFNAQAPGKPSSGPRLASRPRTGGLHLCRSAFGSGAYHGSGESRWFQLSTGHPRTKEECRQECQAWTPTPRRSTRAAGRRTGDRQICPRRRNSGA